MNQKSKSGWPLSAPKVDLLTYTTKIIIYYAIAATHVIAGLPPNLTNHGHPEPDSLDKQRKVGHTPLCGKRSKTPKRLK